MNRAEGEERSREHRGPRERQHRGPGLVRLTGAMGKEKAPELLTSAEVLAPFDVQLGDELCCTFLGRRCTVMGVKYDLTQTMAIRTALNLPW